MLRQIFRFGTSRFGFDSANLNKNVYFSVVGFSESIWAVGGILPLNVVQALHDGRVVR